MTGPAIVRASALEPSGRNRSSGETTMAKWGRSPEMSGARNPESDDAGTWPGVTGRRRAAAWFVAAATIAMSPPWPAARAGEDTVATGQAGGRRSGDHRRGPPPRPRSSSRLTDPRIQQSLKLIPQYRKALEGPQFRQLKAVVQMISGQLHTTWDRGLRDLTGGGIVARVSVEPGHEPQVELLITPLDPKVLEQVNDIFLKMARGDARNKKAPDPVRTSDYRGSVVHVVGGAKGLAYAIVAGRLAAANSTAGLERLVDRLQAKTHEPSAARDDADVVLRGHVDMERLRKLDPKKYALPAKPDTGVVFLFGSWYEALKQARAIDATVRWSETEFTAASSSRCRRMRGRRASRGSCRVRRRARLPPLQPPGTIASLSLWRDWATIWESRAELFTPEVVQGFAQLDTLAGQFFGGREFGADVLGAFDPHWRLVIAQQDYAAMKPAPDTKLPGVRDRRRAERLAGRLRRATQDRLPVVRGALQHRRGAEEGRRPRARFGGGRGHHACRPRNTWSRRRRRPRSAPGATRYNFSPSTAQVGRYFMLSSSVGLARSLVEGTEIGRGGGNDQKQDPRRPSPSRPTAPSWPGCSSRTAAGWSCRPCSAGARPRRTPGTAST